MPDWVYPDSKNGKRKRKMLREQDSILQTVSHLASGAKHFDGLSKRHKSVQSQSSSCGGFSSESFSTASFDAGSFQFAGITITLSSGESIFVIDLAQEVYDFWSRQINQLA
jgi:hypothetical protein